MPEEDLIAEIKAVIAKMPTYSYRRVHAVIRDLMVESVEARFGAA